MRLQNADAVRFDTKYFEQMKTIGLISDTHGYLDERVFDHFANCDEIWHAGDIGSVKIIDQLEAFKPCRIVFGNIDNNEIRARTVENLYFDLPGWIVCLAFRELL